MNPKTLLHWAKTKARSAAPSTQYRWWVTLRRRLQNWLHQRLPASDTLTLSQRRVYILPTRAGWMLLLTLLLLLLASINYQLNLGYLLTFLLAGSAAVGMYICQRNLCGLTLHLDPPLPAHAGQALTLALHLHNPQRRTRFGIGLGVINADAAPPALAWTDVPAQGSANVQASWRAPQRGRHPLPALMVQTLFPLGTFRVWAVWRTAALVLVYPSPELPAPPLPLVQPHADGSSSTHASSSSSGEFDGVRAYRRGDPQKTVVWKKAAQAFAAGRNELVSRDTLVSQHQQLWLDHAHCGAAPFEARLSRLCAWVLLAERLGLDYGLRLPGCEIAPSQGPAHCARCLEALALC